MMLDATVDQTWDIAEAVAHAVRNAGRPLGGNGGTMYLAHPSTVDIEERILKMFALHPEDELQLLEIAGKSHISGRLDDLKHAADALVENGALHLTHRDGARYYGLGGFSG
jgi:hypothetical protein